MAAGYIYAIHAARDPGLVKLGLSAKPRARLKTLQTGNPYKLDLIWVFPCPDMTAAEGILHRAFGKYRLSGEWFDFNPNTDPEHIGWVLTMLAGRYLAEDPWLRERLNGIEDFINRSTGFPVSQRYWEALSPDERPQASINQLLD